MSCSGLLDDQTKTSLGFTAGAGGVSQITAGSGITLSPAGGTGVVEVSVSHQPAYIVEFKQDVNTNFNGLAPFPAFAQLGTFTTTYTPPVDGYLQIVVSGYASHGSPPPNTITYFLSLEIDGVQYGGFDNALMAGQTAATDAPAKANMSFSFPYDAVAGVAIPILLVASVLGSDGTDVLTNMSWMITFFPTTPIPPPVAVMSARMVEDAPTTKHRVVKKKTFAELYPTKPEDNQTQVYWA
jgi:hypothetical protein